MVRQPETLARAPTACWQAVRWLKIRKQPENHKSVFRLPHPIPASIQGFELAFEIVNFAVAFARHNIAQLAG